MWCVQECSAHLAPDSRNKQKVEKLVRDSVGEQYNGLSDARKEEYATIGNVTAMMKSNYITSGAATRLTAFTKADAALNATGVMLEKRSLARAGAPLSLFHHWDVYTAQGELLQVASSDLEFVGQRPLGREVYFRHG